MRLLAAVLVLTATAAAQTLSGPSENSTDHLRFTLVLAGLSTPASLASLLPSRIQTSPCPPQPDIYLYSASDPQLIATTHAAYAALGDPCPAPPVRIAQESSPDTLFTTQSSNLLAHLLDTLQQAAGTPATPAAAVIPVTAARVVTGVTETPPPTAAALAGPAHDTVKADAKQPATIASPHNASPQPTENRINGAFGPAGTRLVYIGAPGSSLSQVAAMLGLPPIMPGAQLIFQLIQKRHKKSDLFPPWKVRVFLQSASTATPVATKACKSSGCDLPVFLHAARAQVDLASTTLDVPATQDAPQSREF